MAHDAVGEQPDPFLDRLGKQVQMAGQIDAEAGGLVLPGAGFIVHRVGDHRPALGTEEPDRARHMEGRGDEDPGLARRGVHQRLAVGDVFEGVARLPLEDHPARIHPHPLQHLPRGIGLAEPAAVEAGSAAGEDQLRIGISAGQIGKGQEALGIVVDSGLAALGSQQRADRAAEHDDAVDMVGHLGQPGKAILQGGQKPVPNRQNGGNRQQQTREDDDPPSQPAPSREEKQRAQNDQQRQQIAGLGEEPEGLRQVIDHAASIRPIAPASDAVVDAAHIGPPGEGPAKLAERGLPFTGLVEVAVDMGDLGPRLGGELGTAAGRRHIVICIARGLGAQDAIGLGAEIP